MPNYWIHNKSNLRKIGHPEAIQTNQRRARKIHRNSLIRLHPQEIQLKKVSYQKTMMQRMETQHKTINSLPNKPQNLMIAKDQKILQGSQVNRTLIKKIQVQLVAKRLLIPGI